MEKRVSVAMAVYNSEKYIKEQIDSILIQLDERDELVISYNESTDSTWQIICEYEREDKRIQVTRCDIKGIQANFNNAIINTKGRYIFLADHDDVWIDSKVETVLKKFEDSSATVVMHSRIVTDGELNPLRKVNFEGSKFSNKFINNFIANRFCGSSMAFRRELIPLICPLPSKIVYHDVWIGLIASIYGSVVLLNEPLIFYRRHGSNESADSSRNLYLILKDRIALIYYILKQMIKLGKVGIR